MGYWKKQGEFDPAEVADLYLRLTRVADTRYAFDFWVQGEHARFEEDLPEGITEYIYDLLDDIYYHSYAEQLREVAARIWQEFVPERLRTLAEQLLNRRDLEEVWGVVRELAEDLLPLRIRLELRDPLLHYLPWEYLPFVESYPVTASYPARFTPPHFDVGPLEIDLPLRMLFVSANPEVSKAAVDGPGELAHLQAALAEIAGDRVDVISLLDASIPLLAKVLSEQGEWFHVLHFAGHGLVSPSGPLLALSSKGRSQFLSPAELGELARSNGVQLLTLQTPVNSPNYQLAAFAGFAAQIQTLGLPAVLFDLRPDYKQIPNIARVYEAITRGIPLDRACAQASRAAPEEGPILALSLHTHRGSLFQVKPRIIDKGTQESMEESDWRMLERSRETQSRRKQLLQQIDYFREKVDHLERMRQTYADAPPPWLSDELADQTVRLEQLLGKLGEEA